MTKDIAVHLNPVWRDRADFIIMARLEDSGFEGHFEQLWARQLGEGRFEICCIPFFIRDIDLGDHVEVSLDENGYVIQGVVWKSGHYTFRAWFGSTSNPRAPEEVVSKLREFGCLYESFSNNLLSIDAPSEERAQELSDYLATMEQLNYLKYETGRT
jgi:hypothetical protein